MWPFDKKNNQPVWRDSKGEIVCPGDNCPQEKCDDSCPVWCNTMMVALSRMGHPDKAIKEGEKAVKLAPDSAEFWNNLASMYGQTEHHLKAYECYKKALELRPGYPAALNGLKIAEEHLGAYNCDFTEEDAKDVIQIANDIPELAHKLGFFPYPSLPFVPELIDYLNHVPQTILDDLNEDFAKRSNSSLFASFRNISTAVAWCFYAGLAAVTLWHLNWPELKRKGLMPILYESATAFDLDEHIFNFIYGADTDEEYRQFHQKFNPLCLLVISKFGKDEIRENIHKTLLKMSQVSYMLGCAYRLHEIGIH